MPRKDARVLGEELVPLTGRFPLSVVTRIDARLDAMRRAMPGIPLGRSDVLRVLLVQALDALDAEAEPPETPTPQKPPRPRKRQAQPVG
jgi:hypothetical protein